MMDGSYFKKIADNENSKKRVAREIELCEKFKSVISGITDRANKGYYYADVAIRYSDHQDFLELFDDRNFKFFDSDWSSIAKDNMHEFYQSPEHTIAVIISWQHVPTQ